ncbi:hypothetical protein Tco_1363914, partial [Tanacetum coccineum]
LKGSMNVNSSTSTAATAIAWTESVEFLLMYSAEDASKHFTSLICLLYYRSLSKAHLPSLTVDPLLACYLASKLQVPLSVDNPFQAA